MNGIQKTIRQKIGLFWSVSLLAWLMAGCASTQAAKRNVTCRLVDVEQGVSIFLVSINGKEFEHKSPVGGIEFFENSDRTLLKIRVFSEDSRGTYIGGEIDHYYHIGNNGRVTYMGNLKETWFVDEDMIRVNLYGFHPFVVPMR